jgi:hypothetical protein
MIDLLSFTPSNLALTTHKPPQIGSSLLDAIGRGHGHPSASFDDDDFCFVIAA